MSGALSGPLQQIGYIGGCLLIASAWVVYYTAAAMVLNSVYRRTVLPLGVEV